MTWRTSKLVLAARNLGRSLGVNRFIAKAGGPRDYEDRFQSAMLGAVRSGDVVWDVGANVGLYSTKFASLVGPTGKVFAYEPSPNNLQRLRQATAAHPTITVVPVALGDREDTVVFQQGADALGATSRIIERPASVEGGEVRVRLTAGDRLISEEAVKRPNVVKIDTEGYELDVLLGLKHTLASKDLRVLCIEMHFGLLQERGLPMAASQIEELLLTAGFALSWPDASHIVARRSA